MHPIPISDVSPLLAPVQHDGFCFATADTMRPLLDAAGGLDDWQAFADSWNRLEPDAYIAATGRSRRRRHATFAADRDGIVQRPHQPHYQSLQYNPLQGNIQRWFEPLEPGVAQGQSLRSILTFCHGFFDALAPATEQWHVEVHQFRIEATADAAGEPTPEGSHRDGVDFVLVLLVDRENIASGSTSIHSPDGAPLGEFTLTHALDTALIHDPRVFHGVTPVLPIDPHRPSHRDVLVVTFRAV
ncbi:MAG TPA: 2OG-Fe dioxygenase family protein [Dyella sp.]|uniref:2OG-Fe dioxygenase family protein n=1 Tax=Dyella sp. TaxID=1869338 RepID=UPI002F952E5A